MFIFIFNRMQWICTLNVNQNNRLLCIGVNTLYLYISISILLYAFIIIIKLLLLKLISNLFFLLFIIIILGTIENLGIDEIERGPSELYEELKKKNIPLDEFHEVYIGEIIKIEKKSKE